MQPVGCPYHAAGGVHVKDAVRGPQLAVRHNADAQLRSAATSSTLRPRYSFALFIQVKNCWLSRLIDAMSLTSRRHRLNDASMADAIASTLRAESTAPAGAVSRQRKLATHVVVCSSLMVITLDFTILNVALPTLARDLGADTSALQWFINAYELTFAGLLLTAGALADRYGRRTVLEIGLLVFGIASLGSALASSSGELIIARSAMGIGGAMVVPATLSIVSSVFTEPSERARAIAVWAGVAALGLGLGPLVGGLLLRHFYWGSAFLVGLPLVIGAVVGGRAVVPESRNPAARRLDPIGAALSIVALGGLLYGLTEAPKTGWLDPVAASSLVIGAVGLASFLIWERRTREPMLDLGFFRKPTFSIPVVAIMTIFFGMFGLMFVSTQALQSILGYDTLGAGARLLPLPAMLFVFAQVSVRVVPRVGTRAVVATGLAVTAIGLAVGSTFDAGSGYGVLAITLTLTGVGIGCTMAPAVEMLMSTVPPDRAAMASAVNDTTRLSAGAVGVAVIGSVVANSYRASLNDAASGGLLGPELLDEARASIAHGVSIAAAIDRSSGDQLLALARQGFIDGASRGLTIAAMLVGAGALVAWKFMPRSDHLDGVGPKDSAALGDLQLRPIGRVESALKDPADAPCQGNQGAPDAWITISDGVRPGLLDLQKGETVLILTWLDRARRDVLAVHPQGNPANPITAVFSTRSPHRPNPIGLHRVQIRDIHGTRLLVGPLEAVDQTPVLDIKPVLGCEEQ
jgi:tRNA-Thr(GGU) m(6)t(6)A37 methyltransferase TsaA